MNITPERIATAYQHLADGKRLLYEATSDLTETTNTLDDVRFVEMAQGKIVGKNEGEREGNFRAAHPDMLMTQRHSDQKLRNAKLMHDLAQLEVDEIARTMRLYELTQTLASVPSELTA
jgi:hypothetical protein